MSCELQIYFTRVSSSSLSIIASSSFRRVNLDRSRNGNFILAELNMHRKILNKRCREELGGLSFVRFLMELKNFINDFLFLDERLFSAHYGEDY